MSENFIVTYGGKALRFGGMSYNPPSYEIYDCIYSVKADISIANHNIGGWKLLTNLYSINGAFSADTTSVVESVQGLEYLSALTGLKQANELFWHCDKLKFMHGLEGLCHVESAQNMFAGCTSLTGIKGLEGMTSLKNAGWMFLDCSNLTGSVSGYVSKMPTSVTAHQYTFSGCTSLYDYSAITADNTHPLYSWVL